MVSYKRGTPVSLGSSLIVETQNRQNKLNFHLCLKVLNEEPNLSQQVLFHQRPRNVEFDPLKLNKPLDLASESTVGENDESVSVSRQQQLSYLCPTTRVPLS